ncbi:MAG: tetratricopeptide repeat protein [Bacteroidetes bacterium]|nr:tetratricopeptide repeat protein [Bacteroidota bacterium]
MKEGTNIFAHTDCLSEEMLTKYISDKLSSAEKHEVEKHLIDCEMCSDAVEGWQMIYDKKKISNITSELNQKIQTRIDAKEEKKEVKIIFLRQYRTQLAVAASILLVVGLVWFFKSNVSMKEMDNAEAEKMFAEKFSPPPADLDNEATTGKEQSEPDSKNPVTTAQDPTPLNNISLEEAQKKSLPAESPSFSSVEGAKSGKDIAEEKHLGLAENKMEDVPVQNADQLRKGIVAKKSEEKEDKNYWRYKEAETTPKGNVTTKSEVTVQTRDEDGVKDEKDQTILLSKEVSKNQNEFESLKEKDKKADETKKPQSTTVNTEVVTATGASSVSANQPVQDKSSALMQDNKKTMDDRERNDANAVNRAQEGQGDVLAYESGKKTKEEKSGGKGKEDKSPKKKISSGYYDMKTSTSAPMPETQSQTKATKTEVGAEINGKLDSVAVGGTFGTILSADGLIAIDSAMIKYDKQDYGGAVNDFEQTLKQNPNDEKALFYSAVSYMSLGQTDKALVNLNKILANKNSKYYEDAQWYSSLAYIKNNDTKNARMNLIPLQNNSKSKYQKQADETLREIMK